MNRKPGYLRLRVPLIVAVLAAFLSAARPASAQSVSYSSDTLGFTVQIPSGYDPAKVVKRSGSELVNWPDGRRLFVLKQAQSGTLQQQFETFLKINLGTLKGGRTSDQQSGPGFIDAVVNYQGASGELAGVFSGREVEGGAMLFAFTGIPAKSSGSITSVRENFRRAAFESAQTGQAGIDYCTLGLDTKDDRKAELLLKKCVEQPRSPSEAFVRLAGIQAGSSREQDALSTLELGRKQFPREAVMLKALGRILVKSTDDRLRDPYRAASLLQLASAASRQQDPEAELLLMEAQILARQCEEALQTAERFQLVQGVTDEQTDQASAFRAKAKDPSQCKR